MDDLSFYHERVPAIGWDALHAYLVARCTSLQAGGAEQAHEEGRLIELHTRDGLIAVCPGTGNEAAYEVHTDDSAVVQVEVIEGGPEKVVRWLKDDEVEAQVAADLRERGNDDVKALADEALELARQRKEQSRRAIVQLTYADLERFFGLPADFQVVSVFAEPERASISMVVHGPTLAPVGPGCAYPRLNGTWNQIPLRVPWSDDVAELVTEWQTDPDTGERYTLATRFEWRPW